MKNLRLRLAILLLVTIIVTSLPLSSFAEDTSTSQKYVYDYAHAYDLEGLRLYKEAYDNLVSVSESVYCDNENEIISTYYEKILDLEDEQELNKLDSILNNYKKEINKIYGNSSFNLKLSKKVLNKISSLLNEFESELENQYTVS